MNVHLASFFIVCVMTSPIQANPKWCSYTNYQWNVKQRKAVNVTRVKIPYPQRSDELIDKGSGCSVCEEDQVELNIQGIQPFKVCKFIAPRIESVFGRINQQNFPIFQVTGYRVGLTRGAVDKHGNRTQFSNHSFGIAIDINEQQNGLYDNCLLFNSDCRLIKGGVWDPEQRGSITKTSAIVRLLKLNGFQWGGEIEGVQKDFMHFSLTGY